MKLSPYVLIRIGGLPFKTMADLSWSDKKSLEEYFNAQEVLKNHRTAILEDLQGLIKIIDDYPAKFYLKIIRRDIFNRRNFKLKPFEYQGSQREAFLLVISKLKNYKQRLFENQTSKQSFNDLYQKEIHTTRSLLSYQALPDPLTKGLQLASHSLLKRLERYLQIDPAKVNKKILQTERTLLQYLSRISTKTSPFSSFTKLAAIDLNQKTPQSAERKVRLNNTLYRIFRDSLIHYPPFFKDLNIRLNSSLKKNKTEWVFLLNTRNIESIQKMESSNLIDFILESLSADRTSKSFENFVHTLLEEIEADFESMSKYVLQLIDYGLIEWDWSFSGLDPQWHFKLKEMLKSYKDDVLLNELKAVIEKVENQMALFESGDLEERKLAQQISFNLLKSISKKLLSTTGLENLEQSNTSDHLRRIFSTDFKVPVEQIFYEDVSQEFDSPFDKKDFDIVANDLERLVQLLVPITFNTQKETLLAFYKNNFLDKNIELLAFYEAYFQHTEIDIQAARNSITEKRSSFIKTLKEKGTWINQNHFHLDWNNFPIAETGNYKIDKSKASLVQLYKEEGKTKAFTDAVFMGYGKMFGRFLNLFPATIEKDIRSKNSNLSKGDLWMELTDASIYNPNVHPALVPLEIQMPGSQNNLEQSIRIPIDQLEIVFYKNEDRLALNHKEENKEVYTFNFGFEALENRSPMYRILSSFAFQSVSPDLLSTLLNELLKKEDAQKVIHKPRITVGDHLIIQRKSWGIPKILIPFKENAQEDATYFFEINKWRKSLGLPVKVFISINPLEYQTTTGRTKGDDYKPQYIDFESPVLVQLFSKLINKIPVLLKVEEMLPELNEENDYVQEYLLEWGIEV